MSEMIYHLTLEKIWKDAQDMGYYSPSTLATEGFIHCSTKGQLLRVANQLFIDQPTIFLLVINQNKLTSQVMWEPGTDKPDEMFPHIFGIINIDAVDKVYQLSQERNGLYSLPDEINE